MTVNDDNNRGTVPNNDDNNRGTVPNNDDNNRGTVPNNDDNNRGTVPNNDDNNRGTVPNNDDNNRGTVPNNDDNNRGTVPNNDDNNRGTVPNNDDNNRGTVPNNDDNNRGTVPNNDDNNRGTVPNNDDNNRGTVPNNDDNNRGTVPNNDDNNRGTVPNNDDNNRGTVPNNDDNNRGTVPNNDDNNRGTVPNNDDNNRGTVPNNDDNNRGTVPNNDDNNRGTVPNNDDNNRGTVPNNDDNNRGTVPNNDDNNRGTVPNNDDNNRGTVPNNDDNNRGTVPNNDDNNRGTVPNNDDTTGPEFVSTRFVFTLAENQVGTVPVLTPEGHPGVVRTTGAGVRYTLAADGGGRFRIDASTGAVTHVGSGTRAGHYELTVRATDARGREAETPVIVEVLSTAAVTRLNRVQRTVLPEAVRMATGSAFAAVSGRLEAGRTANRLRVAGYEVLNGAADGAGTFADGACGVADGCDEGGDKTSARGPTTFDLTQVLTGSEFTLPLSATGAGTAGGLTPVLWGAVDWTALSGSGTAPDWDGGMLNAHLGADVRLGEHLLVGVALSHARGSFDWTDQGDDQAMTGTYKSRLTSLMPYLGWTAHERLEMWAATTLGRAEITLDDVAAGKYDSAATAWSAGTGARGTLLADGPTALALKGEAWVSRWAADGTDPVAALEADVQRLRLALEGRHAWTLASGAVVAPSLEVGVRHDSGAGETGTGLELGGGVHWNDPIRGLTFQARARTLLGRGGYRQWGIAGLASLDPGADGLGLALSVAPAWGVADSGLARLWDEGMAGRPTATLRPNPRLEGRLGYGVSAPGTLGTITPYAGLSLAGTQAQTWRTGVRLNAGAKIDAHLETTWRETIGGAPDRGVILEVRLRF